VQVRHVLLEMFVIQVSARSLSVSIVWAQLMLLLLHSSFLVLKVLLQYDPLIGLDLHTSRFMALSATIETISATLLTLSLSLVHIIARLLFILHLEDQVILMHVCEVLYQLAFLSFDHSSHRFTVTWLGLRKLSLNHLLTVDIRHVEWIGWIAFVWFRSYVLITALFINSDGCWCILELVSISLRE